MGFAEFFGKIPAILFIVIPPVFAIILTFAGESRKLKIVSWCLAILIMLLGVYNDFVQAGLRKLDESILQKRLDKIDNRLQDIIRISVSRDLAVYLDQLEENESLADHLVSGKNFMEKSEYDPAIVEYNKCMSSDDVTMGNKIALHILIGNCHFNLTRLKDSEESYQAALIESIQLEDENEKMKIWSVAHNNLGLVYQQLGMLDESLKSRQIALEYFNSLGDDLWSAKQLQGLGHIYRSIGQPYQALKYSQMALEKFKALDFEIESDTKMQDEVHAFQSDDDG